MKGDDARGARAPFLSSQFLHLIYEKEVFTMIKNLKEDYVKICVGIEETLDDTVLWPFWYFIKGHIIGCVIVYWLIVIGAAITGKKWDLVERDQ